MSIPNAEIELLIPTSDVENPEVSIVIPALNESINIAEFVQWCHIGLADAGVRGEILIVDSSTDDTPQIAVREGARVLRCPKRGLGRAYIDALPYVRGKWIIMGDADCTYDFRQLKRAPCLPTINISVHPLQRGYLTVYTAQSFQIFTAVCVG